MRGLIMKYSDNYKDFNNFVDDVLIEASVDINKKEIIKDEFFKKIVDLENEFKLKTKRWLSILIGILFIISYLIVIVTLCVVFYNELDLIKNELLQPVKDQLIQK